MQIDSQTNTSELTNLKQSLSKDLDYMLRQCRDLHAYLKYFEKLLEALETEINIMKRSWDENG